MNSAARAAILSRNDSIATTDEHGKTRIFPDFCRSSSVGSQATVWYAVLAFRKKRFSSVFIRVHPWLKLAWFL